MFKKYSLQDVYDGVVRLGEFNTMCEVRDACRTREKDTHGDCEFRLFRYNEKICAYVCCYAWRYSYDN